MTLPRISPIRIASTTMPLPEAVAAALPEATRRSVHVRIPALAVTTSGRIVCAFDLRPSFHDLPGDLSIGYRASDDGGATWSDVQLLIAAENGWGFGDASLVALNDNQLLCFYVASHGLSFWDDGGMASGAWELRVAHSRDNGATWTHRNISQEILADNPSIEAAFFSSGNGIQLHNGRIMQPLVWRGKAEREPHVLMVISDDGGASWRVGGTIPGQADETKIAQEPNGTVWAAVRGYPSRTISYSHDGGESWSKPVPAVNEPGCNAGFTRWNDSWALTIPQPHAHTTSELTQTGRREDPALGDPSGGRSASSLQDWSARHHLCLLTGASLDSLQITHVLDSGSAAYSVALPLPHGELAVVWEHGNYEGLMFATLAR